MLQGRFNARPLSFPTRGGLSYAPADFSSLAISTSHAGLAQQDDRNRLMEGRAISPSPLRMPQAAPPLDEGMAAG
jgi:hypothetical protein